LHGCESKVNYDIKIVDLDKIDQESSNSDSSFNSEEISDVESAD